MGHKNSKNEPITIHNCPQIKKKVYTTPHKKEELEKPAFKSCLIGILFIINLHYNN